MSGPLLRIPPISHLPDKCGVNEAYFSTTAIIGLVENEEEIGRVVFTTPFHPTLLSLPRILRNSASALQGLDPVFDKIMSRPPIVAWNRGKTLKECFAPSKFPKDKPPPPGTLKCERNSCVLCKDVQIIKSVIINNQHRRVIGIMTVIRNG